MEENIQDVAAPDSLPVCRVEDIPLGMGHAFHVQDESVAIFRTRAGKVFATANSCPHRGGPLADGIIAGEKIVCPFHAFRFDLASGTCEQANVCAVETYETMIVDGWVHVRRAASSG